MGRLLVPIFNMIMMLIIGILQPSGVSMKMDVPSEVIAGTEFEVRITLDKGDLESFSRFQMDIPAGLTALSESSANADFSFSDKRVRLIWLRLPNPQEFTFAFKVKVDERLKGTFNLDGQFSYIYNNERKTADLTPRTITIEPSPDIDPGLVVDIHDFEKKVIQYIPPVSEGTENIACIRQTPYLNDSHTEFIVNILVSKQDKEKFAKIEESVPGGYNAVALNTNDALFTFKNQKVKFLWMNLPASPEFYVSYRLIPRNGTGLKVPDLNGTFSFMEGDKTISVDIMQTDNDIAGLNPQQIHNLVAELRSKPAAKTINPEEITKTEVVKEPVSRKSEPVAANTRITERKRKGTNSYLLQPDPGIYYRIQVAAGHKPVDIRRYFKKFNLDLQVKKENHEGWIKYSVGSFDVYKDARDYRVHIWNTTAIDDAFVAAYNNGERITVQEALMIADQKWYK